MRCHACRQVNVEVHPDVFNIDAENERTLGIDSVRQLREKMALMPQEAHGRIGVIKNLDQLSERAFDGLLKTIEEPPALGTILMISDGLRVLPPTIMSRSQRMVFCPPSTAVGLKWLSKHAVTENWNPWLALSGGAPLLAIHLRERADVPDWDDFVKNMLDLICRRVQISTVLQRWNKMALEWIYGWIWLWTRAVLHRCLSLPLPCPVPDASLSGLDAIARRISVSGLFGYMDEIRALRHAFRRHGMDSISLMETMLMPWMDGFKMMNSEHPLW